MSPVQHKQPWRDLSPLERHQRVMRSVESTEDFIKRKRAEEAAEERAQQIVAWIACGLLLLVIAVTTWRTW
jgi:hypothetical protein